MTKIWGCLLLQHNIKFNLSSLIYLFTHNGQTTILIQPCYPFSPQPSETQQDPAKNFKSL